MKLKDTGLTAQDIKDKVNKYMIETYERFDFLAETAKDMYLYDENKTPYLDFYAGIAAVSYTHLQLEKFPSFVERRRHNFDRLRAALADIEDKVILPVPCDNSRPSWFGFLITVREGLDRKAIVEYIESHGVQTRNLFAGNLIKHPCFDEMRATGEGYKMCIRDRE